MSHFTQAIKFHAHSAPKRTKTSKSEGSGDDSELIGVDPRDTDSRIKEWTEPHWVAINPNVPPNGRLLAFFAGSFVKADRLKSFLHCAASLGYLAINLRYPNSWTVGDLCRQSEDPECHAAVRREIAEGIPAQGQLGLGAGDSIVTRLTMLLRWLEKRQPEQGWGDFLTHRGLHWGNIVLAGHSQGSGHAAFLAKRHRVARVVMLGGPADFCLTTDSPAPWLGSDSKTPVEKFFGFSHERDQSFVRTDLAWEVLGLGKMGLPVNVDGEEPPYNGSHRLYTDLDLANDRFHASVATDGATPRSVRGEPVYEPVWRYLLGDKDEN